MPYPLRVRLRECAAERHAPVNHLAGTPSNRKAANYLKKNPLVNRSAARILLPVPPACSPNTFEGGSVEADRLPFSPANHADLGGIEQKESRKLGNGIWAEWPHGIEQKATELKKGFSLGFHLRPV